MNASTILPKINGLGRGLELLQEQWKKVLEPVIAVPLNNGLIIQASLITGNNIINTLLLRKQQGWMIIDQDAASSIYRSAPLNDKTLTLNASAPANVSLWVF